MIFNVKAVLSCSVAFECPKCKSRFSLRVEVVLCFVSRAPVFCISAYRNGHSVCRALGEGLVAKIVPATNSMASALVVIVIILTAHEFHPFHPYKISQPQSFWASQGFAFSSTKM